MIKYRTLYALGQAELTIERSKFIGYAQPVSTREEADAFFADIRAAHKKASHCVPAFALGEKRELLWASDDKEPQGIAGSPMLALLTALDLTNACIMAVRYFGGIKLGTGGLARAYTETAKLAIKAAGIAVVEASIRLSYRIPYDRWGEIEHCPALSDQNFTELSFTDKVGFCVTPSTERADKTHETITALAGGQAELVEKCAVDYRHPVG